MPGSSRSTASASMSSTPRAAARRSRWSSPTARRSAWPRDFSGTLGAYAKGAPIRVIGSTFTGGSQLFWYVPANSPIKSLRDTDGKTVAYSTNGSSTHTAVLALQKSSGAKFKPTQTGAAPATLTQVMSGQIDVGWAGAPFGVDAVEQGKIRVIAKASDDPVLDRQTIRLLIANLGELTQRKDVIVRFMRGYREALDWVYATPEGLKAYAAWSSINEATARRALQEFLPKEAVNPDRMSGLDDIVADAVTFKYIPAPLTSAQLSELIQIPERRAIVRMAPSSALRTPDRLSGAGMRQKIRADLAQARSNNGNPPQVGSSRGA